MKICGLILFVVLAGVSNVFAGMRASFALDYSAWNATHIVIAGEGNEIDGKFKVFESLKGDLGSGETIFIEALAAFGSESLRQVKDQEGETEFSPKYVSGERMILFLKKNGSGQNWEPADLFKDFKASVIWLEASETFAIMQISNPGPSIMVTYGKTESEIKNRIFEVTELRNSFDGVLQIEDQKERAAELEKFAVSDFFPVRPEAFEALKKCGKNALPVLRKMLKEESLLEFHDKIIETLAAVGGSSVGNDLTEIVRQELNFWKRTAPALEIGWWNKADQAETANLHKHYSKVLSAIYQLRLLKFANSRKVVTQFRDFWRSLPQLADKSGTDQLTDECDQLLRDLDSK